MQQIQSHELQDIYRVQDGLLVVVNKYESFGSRLASVYTKGKRKRVNGVKGLQVLTSDVKSGDGSMQYDKGTFTLYDYPVRPTKDVNKFLVEVKSSGGSVEGSLDNMTRVHERIAQLLRDYNYGGRN